MSQHSDSCSLHPSAPGPQTELQSHSVGVWPVMLAPMEGVVDFEMRRLLTTLGGFDRCVTEFVRVTDVTLPERVFFRYCPELQQDCLTESGVPVYIQLLGSDPAAMASNAVRAADLGAPGIDLNFGCPAKTVNRSNGGSVLLREPARVADIVRSVRNEVPAHIPVTAKIRLGYENHERLEEIAQGVSEAGANELCIHARTRTNGYKPPAFWSVVSSVTQSIGIPVIINGEIWSVADSRLARSESGAVRVMLGRGALSCPDLALQIKAADRGEFLQPQPWKAIAQEVAQQFERSDRSIPRYVGNRTKQWLAYLKRQYPGAQTLFEQIKPLHEEAAIRQQIDSHITAMETGSLAFESSQVVNVAQLTS